MAEQQPSNFMIQGLNPAKGFFHLFISTKIAIRALNSNKFELQIVAKVSSISRVSQIRVQMQKHILNFLQKLPVDKIDAPDANDGGFPTAAGL